MNMPVAIALLDETCRLLALLPGIHVLDARLVGEAAQLDLACTDAGSAERVQRLCEAANVGIRAFHVGVDDAGGARQQRLALSARTTAIETIAQGTLQLLAIHLVWHLHCLGVLSTVTANQHLRTWSAAAVDD